MARSPDVANIRILSPNDFSNWRLIQDYRERSVLKGFAVVGGLWTFLCGVFAMVFGPSLLHLLFGTAHFVVLYARSMVDLNSRYKTPLHLWLGPQSV
jgi:hypothetical protein